MGVAIGTAQAAVRLTRELRTAIDQGEYAPMACLPAEREMAARYGVSRHCVRLALESLSKEGRIRRIGRGGTIVEDTSAARSEPKSARSLQCITIIQTPATTTGGLRESIETAYLTGYTAALDGRDVKLRFAQWRDDEHPPCNRLLAPDVPLAAQGCILVELLDPETMRWMSERSVPFVVKYFCNYDAEGLPPHHSVFMNRIQAGFEATQHLIDLGHARIGFLGRVHEEAEVRTRYQHHGYEAALRVAGLEVTPRTMEHMDGEDPLEARELACRLLAAAGRPTAIVAQTDAIAIGTLAAAAELGLRVPRDLSIIGFNDQAEAEQMSPPLTTFACPREEHAKAAVEMLLATAEGRFPSPERRILNARLIVRGSTAAPGG